jgi:hypothetical protein
VKISGLKVPAMMSGRGSQELRMDVVMGAPGDRMLAVVSG